jgi:membrane-associated phospholipid phosphatase
MTTADHRIESDYNRRPAGPIRWARVLGIGLVAAGVVVPFDGSIAGFAKNFQEGQRWQLGGDVRLVVNTLQQFGDLATSLLVAWAVVLLDRPKVRRLLDWAAGALLTLLALNILKLVLGRPRPRFDEPLTFIGPAGTHAVNLAQGQTDTIHAWEFWKHGAAQLWSMPSSHTSAAFATAVVLARLYPALRPMVYTLACFVGFARVLVGMHYPSDVVVGATIGRVVAGACMDVRLGPRLLGRTLGGGPGPNQ